MRPLTRQERSAQNRWDAYDVGKARERRGEKGASEEWLRLTRTLLAQAAKAPGMNRDEPYEAFALVLRHFKVALEQRLNPDEEPELWNDLLGYSRLVLEAEQQAADAAAAVTTREQ